MQLYIERPPDGSLCVLERKYWLIFDNSAACTCLSYCPGKRGPDNSPGGFFLPRLVISVSTPILGFTRHHIGQQVGEETERSESEANEVSGLVRSIGESRWRHQMSPFVTTVKDHHKHHKNYHRFSPLSVTFHDDNVLIAESHPLQE